MATYENTRSFHFLEVSSPCFLEVSSSMTCKKGPWGSCSCLSQSWLPVISDTQSSPSQILNPSETFGDIIVDYSYVECTSACITALCAFRRRYPNHRTGEIQASLNKGERHTHSRGEKSCLLARSTMNEWHLQSNKVVLCLQPRASSGPSSGRTDRGMDHGQCASRTPAGLALVAWQRWGTAIRRIAP